MGDDGSIGMLAEIGCAVVLFALVVIGIATVITFAIRHVSFH